MTAAESVTGSLLFHGKHAWFNIKEQFSDLASGIVGFLLFPFLVWIVSKVWERFNSYQGNYTIREVTLYIGVAEILFMSFLRPSSISRATSDFSLSLARPRSWLAMSFSGIFGRCLGSRVVYLTIFLILIPLLGVPFPQVLGAAIRVTLLFPILGLVQGLIGLLFASAQVVWFETSYFVLPTSKMFLILGGVLGPLIDFSEPWKSRFMAVPSSDLFFQPAHFCVRGEFYGMTVGAWLLRIAVLSAALGIANLALYYYARRHHQSYGG